jgi:hypothetical protein
MMPAETLERFERVLAQARGTGNTEVYDKTMFLFLEAVRLTTPPPDAVQETKPRPHDARARAREAAAADNAERKAGGMHKIRAGNETCGAKCRDGGLCQAPAVPGGFVCSRHGGNAPQVKIKAGHRRLQEALWFAYAEWQDGRDTPQGFDLLCETSAAERELAEYERKMRLLAELRAWAKAKGLTGTPVEPCPDARRD